MSNYEPATRDTSTQGTDLLFLGRLGGLSNLFRGLSGNGLGSGGLANDAS